MLKPRAIVYLALLAALGGLLVASVPVDRVIFIGLFMVMVMMHLGGHGGRGSHGGRGRGGREEPGTSEHPVGHEHVIPAPTANQVAGP